MLDIKTIDQNIARLRADIEFWEQAKRILTDPRIAGLPTQLSLPTTENTRLADMQPQAYGDVRKAVLSILPDFGRDPMGTGVMVKRIEGSGFQFKAKHHVMAINDALDGLEKAGKAIVVRKEGIAKLWTKTRIESQGAPGGAP